MKTVFVLDEDSEDRICSFQCDDVPHADTEIEYEGVVYKVERARIKLIEGSGLPAEDDHGKPHLFPEVNVYVSS